MTFYILEKVLEGYQLGREEGASDWEHVANQWEAKVNVLRPAD